VNPASAQRLDRVVEAAVILSWADLMKDSKSGLLHVEYACAADSSLEYLKLWSSVTRGDWRLACDYWMSASTLHAKGVHVENGFRSQDLSQTLEFIMQHQEAFSRCLDRGRTGLLQVQVPTEAESTAAAESVREAFGRVNSLGRTSNCLSSGLAV
jgi:hypothetical protein